MEKMLKSPIAIGGLTIPNRLVMTAARTLLCGENSRMTEDMVAYYARRAQGGVGLIVTEAVCVDETYGRSVPCEMCAERESSVNEFAKLADRVHPYGTKLFAQLFHPGANGDAALSPGGLISADQVKGRSSARSATVQEISHVCRAFGRAALHLKQSGFDGVEVHAAHNYFLQSFLSSLTNHRTDEYGGTLTNRCRILQQITEEIRAACGPDFPLMMRISLEEYVGPGGYHADEGIKICQRLERWGVDAIDVTAGGTASKLSQSMEPVTYRQGWRKHLLRAAKRSLQIPVLGVALVRDPSLAEALLQEGYADLIGSVRAYLADPDWANKALAGEGGQCVRCISCMSCLEMEYKIGRLTCALNPETGYEAELPPFREDGAGRLVLVLGAGPAGLEAAMLLARRGFRVRLYEKSAQPGGQVLLAGAIPRKEMIRWAIEDLARRCREAGVELLLNTAPSVEELAAQEPYAILDATGGKAILPASIAGVSASPLVCTPEDVITGRVDIRGESVVVVGSGMTGLEVAEILSERERDNAVLIMEAAPRLAPGALGSNRNVVTAVLDTRDVVYLLNRKLAAIDDAGVSFEDSSGETYHYPCDRVVLALGTAPARPYGDELETVCARVLRLGDAAGAGKIWHAVHSAYEAVKSL